MSTRKAENPYTPADERYMSSPEFAERRALAGNLVAEKAMLYPDRRHREMLFFLQSVSLRPGGLKRLAREIVATFPNQLGSACMHRAGIVPGKVYSAEVMHGITEELRLDEWKKAYLRAKYGRPLSACLATESDLIFDDTNYEFVIGDEALDSLPVEASDYLLQVCRRQARGLDNFLRRLCLDPALDLELIDQEKWSAEAPYLIDLYGALSHFKKIAEAGNPHAVTTSIGCLVNETLDHALRTHGMVVIEGTEGSGKTTAAIEWTRRHPGQARYITLSGITHKTGFFQKIADAIGLATCQRKSFELQAKIESFLANTRLMLVIDEAHHAWPKTMRVQCAPEIIDWINTAVVNQGVPVALICTDQFSRLKERVERQTGWTSGQFLHRVKRFKKLPCRPTEEDLWTVACRLLPMCWNADLEEWIYDDARQADEKAATLIMGYALTSRFPMAAVRDSINEARDLALLDGRGFVEFGDVKIGIKERQVPSDAAMKQAFDTAIPRGRRQSVERASSTPAGPKQMSKIRVSEVTPNAEQDPIFSETSLPVSRRPEPSGLNSPLETPAAHAAFL